MVTISKKCSSCDNIYTGIIEKKIVCNKCNNESILILNEDLKFKNCSFCNCEQFYKRKDFNQSLGFILIIIGSILVPFTYGVSLLIVFILDLILYNFVNEVIVCYKCGIEFRGFKKTSKSIKLFDHHTAELYDKY